MKTHSGPKGMQQDAPNAFDPGFGMGQYFTHAPTTAARGLVSAELGAWATKVKAECGVFDWVGLLWHAQQAEHQFHVLGMPHFLLCPEVVSPLQALPKATFI